MDETVAEENHSHCVLLAHPALWRDAVAGDEAWIEALMTGPQLENGHVRIANELLDAILRAGFTKRQLLVLFFIARKTYGYGKKTDDMTVQQIANGTGLTRPHASATVRELEVINAVLKRDGKYGYLLGINKNYGEWRTVPKQDAPRPETGHVPKRERDRPETGHTINNSKNTKGELLSNSAAPLWREMVALLGEENRALIGRWAKYHGPEKLADAYLSVQQHQPADPKTYLCEVLKKPVRRVAI